MASNMSSTASKPDFLLHTYYKSSCSARLRLALKIKGIDAEYAYVALYKDEQFSNAYTDLNPSGTVPVLTHLIDNGPSFPITQSVAALEYLEDCFPEQYALLPPISQPLNRAKVRSLVSIITNDVQPLTTRRVTKAVSTLGGDPADWMKRFITRGLLAYEKVAAKTAGKYSVGDDVSMADVCLLPAIYQAEKNDVELGKLPTIMRIYRSLSEMEAVKKAHWSVQEDCPTDMVWR